jgi:predicted O-methyltransferase YrrM
MIDRTRKIRPKDWFEKVKDEFAEVAMLKAGEPITYVEIGVWLGESAAWVCENVLTHEDSRGVGIDPYPPDRKRTQEQTDKIKFAATNRLRPWFMQWRWLFEPSQQALRNWRAGKIDLLYIDGSHRAPDVLTDFVLAWPNIPSGGIVIFDDYAIGRRKKFRNVAEAVEAVRMAFGHVIEPIGRQQMQFACRKL